MPLETRKKGFPLKPSEAGPVGRGGTNEAGGVLDAKRRGRSKAEFVPTMCRYCGGIIRLVSAESVYGASAERLGKQNEKIYQCQNCGARVGWSVEAAKDGPDRRLPLAGQGNRPVHENRSHRRF